MKKRIFAFYDLLFYAIDCCPLIAISVILCFILVTQGTREWLYKNWYLVLTFAISASLSRAGVMLFRYYIVENDSIHFHYFPWAKWKKAANNIDILWNQNVFISEIKDIELVKLTEEEKQTKVYYKHWFNKYLKINMKYGNPKYVYIGNYSNWQIKKIIRLANEKI